VKRQQHGVTLLELMAVVVIIGILASIAVPSYRTYVLRSQRTEATTILLRAAAAQEKYYLQNNSYTDVVSGTGATSLKLFSTGSNTEHGWYAVSIAAGGTGSLASSYTVTATANSGQPQFKDTSCRTFTITETGARGAASSASADTTAACWR
jgi:type IV pilus assembly protein PilE